MNAVQHCLLTKRVMIDNVLDSFTWNTIHFGCVFCCCCLIIDAMSKSMPLFATISTYVGRICTDTMPQHWAILCEYMVCAQEKAAWNVDNVHAIREIDTRMGRQKSGVLHFRTGWWVIFASSLWLLLLSCLCTRALGKGQFKKLRMIEWTCKTFSHISLREEKTENQPNGSLRAAKSSNVFDQFCGPTTPKKNTYSHTLNI